MTSAPLCAPRRALPVFAFIVAAALSIGCGHGHGHYHTSYGTLEVFNLASSRADLEGVETRRIGWHHDDYRSVRAHPGSGILLDLAAAYYDVSVYWDAGSRETFFDVPVRHASTTTLDVRY
jgi:hypothetical protein